VMLGLMIRDISDSDATQMDVHQVQVNQYPNFEVSGGNLFHILSRIGLKRVSVVINLETL